MLDVLSLRQSLNRTTVGNDGAELMFTSRPLSLSVPTTDPRFRAPLPPFAIRPTRRPGHGTCDGAFEAMLVSRLVVACWGDGEHVHTGHRLGLL